MANSIDEVTISVRDLEAVRLVLGACLTQNQALDLAESQRHFEAPAYSALTNEVARVKQRFDGYMGDYLLVRHELEEAPEEEDDTQVELPELEIGSGETTEASEEEVAPDPDEPLPSGPAIKGPNVKQEGRRVNARKKLAEDAEERDHDAD